MYSQNKKKPVSFSDTLSLTVKPNSSKKYPDRITSYTIVFEPLGKKGRKVQLIYKDQLTAVRIAKKIGLDIDSKGIPLSKYNEMSNDEIKLFYDDQKPDENKLKVIDSITKNSDNRNIKDIFNIFVNEVKNRRSNNTLSEYNETLSFLDKLSKNDCLLSNIKNLGNVALNTVTSKGDNYALSSLHKRFKNIKTALTHCGVSLNFDLLSLLPKVQKQEIIYYSVSEVKAILEAFKNFEKKKNDRYFGSAYYYPYVFFLAYTGTRPEEAIALRINELKINSNGIVQVKIFKAYDGIEVKDTKNEQHRIIPCSKALSEFLIKYTKGKNKDDLLFPSLSGGYITQRSFNQRHFKPIMKEVCKLRSKEELARLTTYNLRHSYATNLVQAGKSVTDIAGLLGDRVETVIRNYLGSDHENTFIPDIY